MKMRSFGVVLFGALMVVMSTSCRSEFEKVRLSNDAQRILKTAHDYYDKEEFLRAQTLYELVLNQFRGTKDAELLFFRYANTHYHLRSFQLSSTYFKNFANTFGYSDYREEADFMAAYSNYQLSPSFRLDQQSTVKAVEDFQDFINKFPNSSRVVQCNELIDELRAKLEEKAFFNGQQYYDLQQYQASIRTLENMMEEFPDSDRAEEVHFLVLRSAYYYAEQSIYQKREERYLEAVNKYNNFVDRYPRSIHRKEAEVIYKDTKKQLKDLGYDGHQNQSARNRSKS